MTPAVLDVLLIETGAVFLLGAIKVKSWIGGEAMLARGLEKRQMAGMRIGCVRDKERARVAVKLRRAAGVALQIQKVRQQRRVAPVGPGLACPGVVTRAMSTRVGHRVDRAGPAVGLAARPLQGPIAQPGLRLGLV